MPSTSTGVCANPVVRISGEVWCYLHLPGVDVDRDDRAGEEIVHCRRAADM
jgi:hypothetical protein